MKTRNILVAFMAVMMLTLVSGMAYAGSCGPDPCKPTCKPPCPPPPKCTQECTVMKPVKVDKTITVMKAIVKVKKVKCNVPVHKKVKKTIMKEKCVEKKVKVMKPIKVKDACNPCATQTCMKPVWVTKKVKVKEPVEVICDVVEMKEVIYEKAVTECVPVKKTIQVTVMKPFKVTKEVPCKPACKPACK